MDKVYVVFWDWCDGYEHSRGVHKVFKLEDEALLEASKMNEEEGDDAYGFVVEEWKLS